MWLTRPAREKSFSVSSSSSPRRRYLWRVEEWGERSGERRWRGRVRTRPIAYRSSMSRIISFSKTSLSAVFECVKTSVRCLGKVCAMLETACTAVSVLPVPGGPTTTVRPFDIAERSDSTCIGVKRIGFIFGASSGYGPAVIVRVRRHHHLALGRRPPPSPAR